MKEQKRYGLKSMLVTTVWILVGCGAIVLLVAGIRKKDEKLCKEVNVNINGVKNNFFIDEKDIVAAITTIAGSNPIGKTTGSFDLKRMETGLKMNIWISKAELFFDNNEILQVNIRERIPVARIFAAAGSSFYIDDSLMRLPLSDKFSARLPVFTGFPSDGIVLSATDSSLLNDIKNVSLAIQADSFWMALIDQVDITSKNVFEMIPKVGNQIIIFGDAANLEQKFSKLMLFYKKIVAKAGLNYYSSINVQYKGQIVAKKRGADDIAADSLRALQIMKWVAANAAQQAGDSLQTIKEDNSSNTVDSSIIQQSLQREEVTESDELINKNITIIKDGSTVAGQTKVVKPQARPSVTKPPVIAKPVVKPNAGKPVLAKPIPAKPKVEMPKKNDY